MTKYSYVYILASRKDGALYIGVTVHLVKRLYEHKHNLYEHKHKLADGHTKKYGIDKLVYYERYEHIKDAIAREKQLKSWKRQWKIELIEKSNPNWNDLYESIL